MDNKKTTDKKREVIEKRLQKAGLELRDGRVVCICPTCGQDVSIDTKPTAAPPAAVPRVAQAS